MIPSQSKVTMMTNDPLSFLDTPTADTTSAQPEPGPSDTTPAGGPARDDQGRFAAKVEPPVPAPVEAKPDPVVTPPPAVVVTPPKEDHNPLLPKYLDTYNELREAKRKLAEFEEERKAKAEQPDPLLDPEGYKAAQKRERDEEIWDVTERTSRIAARRFYGPEVVDAAFKALQEQNDPLLGARIRRSEDPWEEIVRWHKKEQLLAEVGEDPKAYRERIIAEHMASLQQAPAGGFPAAAATPQQATPVAPPASITRAPAGAKAADVPVGPGNAFDQVFPAR